MGITRRLATAREIKVRLRKLTARVPQWLRLWFAGLHEPSGYRIQPCVRSPTFLAFLFAWHNDVRDLQGRHLPRQREHLVHSDPGPIAASRKLAFPIVSSMRSAPSSATLASIAARLFFRSAMP
jgi:hypothetical protein